ncbi:MAG: hypothetical protein GF308_19980 [Candidatus Heimdallarchaeota archaeon]|nr:hypothetical protein [Candidatus Heimdallarchaeota archaeon]
MNEIYRHLIQEINELVTEGTDWLIEGVNEFTSKKISIKIDLTKRIIREMKGISGTRFTQLLWKAGLLPAKNEKELAEKMNEQLREKNRAQVFGLALDTNLLLACFIPHFFARQFEHLERKPVIIIPRAICHELHYKEGYNYRKDNYQYENLLDFFKGQTSQWKEEISQLLFKTSNLSYFEKKWQRLPSMNGRMGLKGSHELRKLLQGDQSVILSKPDHMYYSQKIQLPEQEVSLVDGIFDSLIRYEIDFFKKNTNVELFFITADKHQKISGELEGITSLYVIQPTKWSSLKKRQENAFRNEQLVNLLFELMVLSPYVKITVNNKEQRYYSYIWSGKKPAENIDGLVKRLSQSKGIDKIKI